MTSKSLNLVTWDNMPDPTDSDAQTGRTTSIHVPESTWKHIIQNHVGKQREPWNSVFPDDLKKALMAKEKQFGKKWKSDLRKASSILESEVQESLLIPLVLICQREQNDKKQRTNVWEILLSFGIVAIVHETKEGNFLRTAYFPEPVTSDMDSIERWQEAVRYQIQKYTLHQKLPNSWKSKTYIATRQPRKKRGTEETSHQIRWVTLSSWGFYTDRRYAGMCWGGIAKVSTPTLLTRSEFHGTNKVQSQSPVGFAGDSQ